MKNFNFIYYKTFDVSEIKKNLHLIEESKWNYNGVLRNDFGTHKHTLSIFNTLIPLEWNSSKKYEIEHSDDLPLIIKENIYNIIIELEIIQNGKVGRSMLAYLKPKGLIPPHGDTGFYLESCYRNHIPIKTNYECSFSVGNETINMKEGECYQIDNSKLHSVNNLGNEGRVHLIIDIIPNELIHVK